jgi:hypothetical protein
MTTVGNLSEKGISFFLDDSLMYEIPQSAIIDAESGGNIEILVAARHLSDGKKRRGKIFILEEEFKSFLIDLVDDSSGVPFRSYSDIESFDLSVDFDSVGFIRNILSSMLSVELYKVLEFVSTGIGESYKAYRVCRGRDSLSRVSCDYGYDAYIPIGGWDSYTGYLFYDDFFKSSDEDIPSLWNQMWKSKEAASVIWNGYATTGFDRHVRDSGVRTCYNFINNIYPEHTELLDYRWHEGGYDITRHEMKLSKNFVYNKFMSWYDSNELVGTFDLVPTLNSVSDLGKRIWAPTEESYNTAFMSFDGVQSTKPGEHEFVLKNSKSGYIGVDLGKKFIVNGVRVRCGTHIYAGSDAPAYIRIYGSNDKISWTRIASWWYHLVPEDGSWFSGVIQNDNAYRYISFNWSNTNGGGWTRISDLQFTANIDGAYEILNYDADEKTVRLFTGIAKVDTYDSFETDEQILIDLLGPRHCIQWDEYGNCVRYGYGDGNSAPVVDPLEEDEEPEWLLPEDEMIHSDGELAINSFMAVKSSSFGSGTILDMSRIDINSASSYSIGGKDAFFATEYTSGILCGKTVFNGASGNEYRYGMSFGAFLDEQRWTIDDFMEIYKEHIFKLGEDIVNAASSDTSIRPVDFCEFYDMYHRCPFDGARVYIPKVPLLSPGDKSTGKESEDGIAYIDVVKNIVRIDEDGRLYSEYSETIRLSRSDTDIELNKDEYVSRVIVSGALRVIVSDFMRLKIKIKLDDSFENTSTLKIRMSTSDFTYMTERYFDYAM